MSLPNSPRSARSFQSFRSVRSVSSGTWDQLVEAIVSAESDTRSIHEEPYQPTIREETEEERQQHQQHQHQQLYQQPLRHYNYLDHLRAKRRSQRNSTLSTGQASTAEDSILHFDLRLNEEIDTTLKLPEDAPVERNSHDQEAEAGADVDDDKEDRVTDPDRCSLAGSHSGSSTVHDPNEDQETGEEVPQHPQPAKDGNADSNNVNKTVDDQNLEAGVTANDTNTNTRAAYSAFPTKSKRIIVLSAATASVFAPLSMQIYLPSLTTLVTEFDVSRAKINLTVSIYMIFMAIAPMLMGGVADIAGRRPAMLACFALYLVACVLIALCQSYTQLMGFRILQSIGASPTIAIASAVVADIVTAAERGSYAALVAVPIIFAPTLGPVIGGLLTEYLGWRSIFWFLLIAGSVAAISLGVCFPETCRFIVGDASAKPPRRYRSVLQVIRDPRPTHSASADAERARLRGKASRRAILWDSLTSAVRILCTRERFLLLFYVGLVFSGFQAIATELPTQFKALYGFDSVMIGVMYVPLAAGAMISTVVFGKAMNGNFRRYARQQGIDLHAGQEVNMVDFPAERARLEVTAPSLALCIAGIACWGWVLEAKTSLAAPCVLLFVMGVGLNGVMASTNALLMDVSQAQAGAVMAASNLTRCALGAVASAVVDLMIDNLGRGWTYVVFAAVFVACSPMLLVQYLKGHQWRRQAKEREDKRRMAEGQETDTDAEEEGEIVVQVPVEDVAQVPGIPLVEMPKKEGSDAQ